MSLLETSSWVKKIAVCAAMQLLMYCQSYCSHEKNIIQRWSKTLILHSHIVLLFLQDEDGDKALHVCAHK